MILRLILTSLFLLMPFGCVYAQGEYFQEGQSGYAITGSVSTSSHASAMGLSVGYSHRAMIDLSVGLARVSPDDAGSLDGDLTAGSLVLGSAVHLARQSSGGRPVSVSVQFGLQRDYWSTEMPMHPEGHALWLGGNFTRQTQLGDRQRAHNYLGLRWVRSSVSSKYADATGVQNSESRLLVTLGAAVAIVTGNVDKRRVSYASSQVVIDPSLTFDTRDGSREFAINISFLIGQAPPYERW